MTLKPLKKHVEALIVLALGTLEKDDRWTEMKHGRKPNLKMQTPGEDLTVNISNKQWKRHVEEALVIWNFEEVLDFIKNSNIGLKELSLRCN